MLRFGVSDLFCQCNINGIRLLLIPTTAISIRNKGRQLNAMLHIPAQRAVMTRFHFWFEIAFTQITITMRALKLVEDLSVLPIDRHIPKNNVTSALGAHEHV